MNGSGRGVTGLVSFPGSGNTWVRELLRTVTGICTGTVFSDHSEPINLVHSIVRLFSLSECTL